MRRRTTSGWSAALALIAGFFPLAGTAGPTASNPIIHCYDAGRNQVAEMRAEACKGEIVSNAKAEEIRERRRQRIQSIMRRGKPKPLAPGTRLVSVGTGFFVAKSGHMLTNNHVIEKCKAVSVETPQGQRLTAKVLDTNVAFDLALVQVDFQPKSIAVFRSPLDLVRGERSDLVGYPTQGIAPILPFHTKAELLKKHGNPGDFSRFLIRGDVRGGNSGGPVLDGAGLTIGVIYAQLNSAAVYKQTGKVPEDIGVAVINSIAMEFLRRNAVPYQHARHRPALNREIMFGAAREFIARMGCWR